MRQTQLGLTLIFLLVMSCIAWAGKAGMGAQASALNDMQQEIVNILSRLKFQLADQSKFCRQFLADFRTQNKINYVKPIVVANDYSDAAFDTYKQKCPKLEFRKRVLLHPKIADDVKSLPAEEMEKYGDVYVGTTNFKLYKVDINNNPSDGDEFIFYHEKFLHVSSGGQEALQEPGKDDYDNRGAYLVINFHDCRVSDGLEVDGLRQFSTVPDYSDIINYKGRNYIFDLYPAGGADTYSLDIWEYNKKRTRMGAICIIHPTVSKSHDEK
ncbi:hypothetical protein [Nitrospira lenta]|jgi:hypothetical protein|uniref:Uncharacterized protein n=1 Tax=Nitrospira lenta TaxID=1436998 RepID=A0A330KZV9_9BACT|nr:hypothetical protein [Nitrospira lenta]TKB83665.1 MAG: hypothetical protein E8D44_07530 [Nitrospira sp.]SPP63010.1 exported hypothetical protein [Nitrospira lenta]